MKFIANLIWIILIGFVSAVIYAFLGIAWCITIIGIPFGLQAFKFARLAIWPFGAKVNADFGKHPIANILWFFLGGYGAAFGFLIAGTVFCLSIVGIPFGLQCYKFAKLSCMPFGAVIE